MKMYQDEKGFLSIFDGLIAILIIFILLFSFNTVLKMDISPYSKEESNPTTSQDIMEIMSLKAGNSYSTLETIENTLKGDNNSIQAIEKASLIANEFLNKTIPNKNYCLVETNQLNGTTITSNSEINSAKDMSSSTRNLGNYSFTLYIW